ncbi:MAG: 3-methyl-2-oxobutanoate dehydrogenase subunit beta, partial [Ruminococcus sp.]|nr:3-methyl-2-oxobutanoate dehydrogenase subunit beta [Ruminococcus sp.]
AANGHGNKREHHIINSLYLKPDELENSVTERFARYDMIKEKETDAELYLTEDCDILLCAFGATARVVKSAVNEARMQGIKAGMFRPKTLWPFPVKEINKASENARMLLSVEMSMGQMIDDIKLAINCSKPVGFYGRTGGVIPTPAEVLAEIKKAGGAE